MPLHNEEKKKKLKEEMARIKALTSSVLVSNPSLSDNTSEMISKIGVLSNVSSNNK